MNYTDRFVASVIIVSRLRRNGLLRIVCRVSGRGRPTGRRSGPVSQTIAIGGGREVLRAGSRGRQASGSDQVHRLVAATVSVCRPLTATTALTRLPVMSVTRLRPRRLVRPVAQRPSNVATSRCIAVWSGAAASSVGQLLVRRAAAI